MNPKSQKTFVHRVYMPLTAGCMAMILLGFIAHADAQTNRAPVVTNVFAQQRPGARLVDITYDVEDADGDLVEIIVLVSDDNGATWEYMNTPVASTGVGGNPPAMIERRDGRLCLTYGYRDAPYAMCAKLSADGGATWGKEILLRNDGGNHDLGYPRTVQRADGKVVTVYYFNDHPDGERYVAATIWKP